MQPDALSRAFDCADRAMVGLFARAERASVWRLAWWALLGWCAYSVASFAAWML